MKHVEDPADPIPERVGGDRPPPPPIVLTGRRPDDADAGVTALVRSDHTAMVRLARNLTGSDVVAQEIVADALEEVHRRWGRLADPVDALRTGVVERSRSHLQQAGAEELPPTPTRRRRPSLRWIRA